MHVSDAKSSIHIFTTGSQSDRNIDHERFSIKTMASSNLGDHPLHFNKHGVGSRKNETFPVM